MGIERSSNRLRKMVNVQRKISTFVGALLLLNILLSLVGPGKADELRYEAEGSNARAELCSVMSVHQGYSGTGYQDFEGQGSWVEWDIDVTTAGDHEVTLRYATESDRKVDLLIDGEKVGEFSCSNTQSWESWESEIISVQVSTGRHTFRVVASNSDGPNLDWISIRWTVTHQWQYEQSVVLEPGGFLSQGEYVTSPSGKFKLGISHSGDFVMKDQDSNSIWAAGATEGHRCYMQDDGNLILRDRNNKPKWTSNTSNNYGAWLVIDDGGIAAVVHGDTPLWVDGMPRGKYTGPSSPDLTFPVRGAFYYPWYPETWTVNGARAHFEPELGYYSSGDSQVVESHIESLEYACVDLGIASWWGPGAMLDRARITLLMDETIAMESTLKWTVYHEDEFREDASSEKIRADLDYLKQWFAWHEAWAHMDGRPVIFVYNEEDCEVVDRWMQASNKEWYVVIKLFRGFEDCETQPDSWHQYGPATSVIHLERHSYTISPGFWRADSNSPLLDRVSKSEWRGNVQSMVDSGEPWQLITTFNEAGEGTMVEASHQWGSDSGYGYYLDGLHDICS